MQLRHQLYSTLASLGMCFFGEGSDARNWFLLHSQVYFSQLSCCFPPLSVYACQYFISRWSPCFRFFGVSCVDAFALTPLKYNMIWYCNSVAHHRSTDARCIQERSLLDTWHAIFVQYRWNEMLMLKLGMHVSTYMLHGHTDFIIVHCRRETCGYFSTLVPRVCSTIC